MIAVPTINAAQQSSNLRPFLIQTSGAVEGNC